MAAVPKIALLVETSNTYARELLQGIVSYIHEHGPWSIYLAEQTRGQRLPTWLARWKGDGVIARIENASVATTVQKLRAPTVDMSAGRLIPSLPWVETDDVAVARMAAEHLLDRGFRHFAFVGDNHFNWSRGRELTFVHLAQEAGYDCSVRHLSTLPSQEHQASLEKIGAWIAGLPRPLGIMAAYDPLGKHVLDACRHQAIHVPDEVAVIGVDNDEVFCTLAEPPMSSIVLDPSQDFHREKVRACQHVHVRSNELLPSCHATPIRRRRNVVTAQNIADRLIRYLMPQIGQRTCDPVVSQLRFSRANRTTSASTSAWMRGRPE
jgi:Transcriptional regulators